MWGFCTWERESDMGEVGHSDRHLLVMRMLETAPVTECVMVVEEKPVTKGERESWG